MAPELKLWAQVSSTLRPSPPAPEKARATGPVPPAKACATELARRAKVRATALELPARSTGQVFALAFVAARFAVEPLGLAEELIAQAAALRMKSVGERPPSDAAKFAGCSKSI